MLLRHVAEALEAERALVFVFSKVFEALLVHRVAAVEEYRLLPAAEHVLQTDWAVAFDHLSDVTMVIGDLHREARATGIAVEEVLPTAGAADPATLAVELPLGGVVVVDVAGGAAEFAEDNLAVFATIGNLLLSEA